MTDVKSQEQMQAYMASIMDKLEKSFPGLGIFLVVWPRETAMTQAISCATDGTPEVEVKGVVRAIVKNWDAQTEAAIADALRAGKVN